MAEPTINSNVGVNINPKGMEATLAKLSGELQKVINQINGAGSAANQQLLNVNQQVKALATVSRNMRTLTGFQGQQLTDAATLGRQARALAEYRQGFSKTADAVGVLRGRLVALDVANGKLLQGGKVPTRDSLLKTQNLEQTAAAYGKLTSQVGTLRGRIALLGDDSRKAFAPMLTQLDRVEQKNSKLFGQGNRFNFKPQLDQMQRVVGNLNTQVGIAEKRERVERANLETLRAQGQQLLVNSQYERLAQRATAIRQGQTTLRNADLTGETIVRRASAQQRMASTALAATRAESMLNAELSKPAAQQNADRIQTLINRLQALRREQGLATAEQLKLNQEQGKTTGRGGFFAGLKSVGGNLFDNPEGSGSSFGAGALVGRVGVYAVAASAIYGVITALRDAAAFTVQFEDALAQLQAISGSTATEMQRLSDGIFAVSRTSVNSVLELTKSATVIAQAGYAGAEIEQMLQSVVNLSAASGATTDESVETLTSALGAFQMSASEAARVTDILVAGLNSSKLTIQQMQLGLQYLGNTAAENNITFEELTATMATLADAGIKSGSTAATGTRQMLIDFMDPSEKLISQLERIGLSTADIDVKVLGLSEVLTRLRDAGFDAYGTLETRASAAYTALSRNIDLTQQHLGALNQTGVAEEAAATRAQSLSAQWQQMLNQLAALGNELGQNFIPLMKILLDVVGAVVLSFTALAGAITYPLRVFGLIGQQSEYLGVSLEEARASFEAAGYSAEEAAVRASAMGEGLDDVTTALKDTEAEMASVETQQTSLRSETEKLIMRQEEMAGANGNLNETTTAVSAAVQNLSGRFPGLRDEFAKTQGGIAGLIQAMAALDRKAQETLRNLAQTALAEADMERQAALKESGGVASRFVREGRRAFTPRDRQQNPGLVRDYTQFESLMRQNTTDSLQQAHRLLQRNPQLQGMYGNTYKQLTSALSRYTTAKQNTDTNRERLGTAEFALSREGQELINYMRTDTANSTRAASQGSAGGMNRAQLQATLKGREARYAQLERELADNPYAASLLSAARASSNAAYNRLTPEPEKEKKGRGGKSAAERAAEKRAREAERRERELERIDGKIQKEELEFRKERYDNAVDAFKNAPDLDGIEELIDGVDESLSIWLAAEAEQAVQEIEALNPTKEQRAKMLATAGRKAEELRDSEINKLADTLAGVIKTYIDTTTQAIERQYEEAMRFTGRNVALAQARLEGLNSPLNNNVPDYLKTVMQRRVDVASDRNLRASQGAGESRLRQYQEMLAKVTTDKAEVERRLANLGRLDSASNGQDIVVTAQLGETRRELRGLDADLLKINDSIYDQQLALEALAARYGALSSIPTTFGEGLKLAVEAVRIDIGAADTFGQDLIKNIDQPLRAIHESFKGFFSDLLSGTVSVSDAFKRMAEAIIDSILQMVAVALANQFFKLLLNFVAPGAPNTGALDSLMNQPLPLWNGGEVKLGGSGTTRIKSMYGGGQVQGGLPTRDSTYVHAAAEEYLIRRPAAQSLGKGFLDAINARGASALRGMGQTNIVAPPAPPVNTNVYVIAPEEKPTMGPNDVIATFSSDVLRGGVTKKLIKQVAAGG